MISTLNKTEAIPCQNLGRTLKMANRKSPKMPPPKIPEICHQISKALSALINSRLKTTPSTPHTTVVHRKNPILAFSEAFGLKYLLK